MKSRTKSTSALLSDVEALLGILNENDEFFSDGEGNLRTIVTRKKRPDLSDGARLLVGCISDITDFRRAEALIRYHTKLDCIRPGLASIPGSCAFRALGTSQYCRTISSGLNT
jgi:hypothetical protein